MLMYHSLQRRLRQQYSEMLLYFWNVSWNLGERAIWVIAALG